MDNSVNSFFSRDEENEENNEELSFSNAEGMEYLGNREIDIFGVKKIDSNLNIFNDNSKQEIGSFQECILNMSSN